MTSKEEAAIKDRKKLIKKRYKSGKYWFFVANNKEAAMLLKQLEDTFFVPGTKAGAVFQDVVLGINFQTLNVFGILMAKKKRLPRNVLAEFLPGNVPVDKDVIGIGSLETMGVALAFLQEIVR